jgi:hypothetical protein
MFCRFFAILEQPLQQLYYLTQFMTQCVDLLAQCVNLVLVMPNIAIGFIVKLMAFGMCTLNTFGLAEQFLSRFVHARGAEVLGSRAHVMNSPFD